QTVTGNVTILGNSTTANKLVLNDKGSANSVALKAPDTLASSMTLELPSSSGSNGQVLATNGSGTLSWVSGATGSVTSVTGTAPISVATGTSTPVISMSQANGSTNGYLSSADWTTFNSKQASGSYISALTGDVTASGAGSAAATLAAVAIAGTSTKVTYDVKGRVTSGTSLTAADLPSHSAALITSGTLAVANGGTGLSAAPTNGQIPIGNGANYNLATLTAGTGISINNAAGAVTVSATADVSTKVSKTGDTMTGSLTLPSNGLIAGTNQLVLANGNVGVGTTNPAVSLDLRSRTDALALPSGTSAQQPASPVAGWIRYNSTNNNIEYYNGSIWTAASNAVDPAGMVGSFPMATCPTGWLEANGSAVSRTTYASLFTAISTMYGSGDGSTTFNLPDYRGYFLRGWDHGAGRDPDAASRTARGDGITIGNNVGTIEADQFRSHSHTFGGLQQAGVTNNGAAAAGYNPPTQTNTTSSNGGNETRPQNINVIYCVSTATIAATTTANTGSGSANYIPQWTSTTALGNSPLAVSGSNVGIGTVAPTSKLNVNGGDIFVNSASGNNGMAFQGAANSMYWITQPASTNILSIGGNGGTAPSSGAINIGPTGNVGIGTTAPTQRLDMGGGNISMGYEIITSAGCTSSSGGWASCTATCSAGKQALGGACGTSCCTRLAEYTSITSTSYTCAMYQTNGAWGFNATVVCANIK
ncbi:MAG: phage tail protein, partial [Proteobacteria bacterium]|nr:phage tail protein [Pseudomonadota bacterium]